MYGITCSTHFPYSGSIMNNSRSIYTVEFIKIIDFYLIHCPVENLSDQRVSLLDYHWSSPWKKPYYLNKQLKQIASNPNLLYSCATLGKMEENLRDLNLLIGFPEKNKLYEIAVYYDNKKNQFMSLFSHIRNSIAHGRFKIIKDDHKTYYLLEDGIYRKDRYYISSRIILLEDTLLKWIQLITNGEKKFSEID